MIPLESPVPEIGTPGSGSRGWKRDDGSRIEARSESDGNRHRTLQLARQPLTLQLTMCFGDFRE